MKTPLRIVAAILLTLPGALLAQEAALRQCRAISSAAERLACYDAIALPAAGAPAGPGASATGAARSAAPAAASKGAPVERFGLEHRAAAEQPEVLESRIRGRFEGWRANSVITLENGQAWQVADGSWMGGEWNDPKVTIRRGVFGAFYLRIDDGSREVRVRRVK